MDDREVISIPLIKPPKYTTLYLEVHISEEPIITLVDNGATNNFIDGAFVLRRNLKRIETKEFRVINVRGYQTRCK